MIEIKNDEDCCGCEACVQICPKNCIDFQPNQEGFFYPSVNTELCVECGLCEQVCPILNQKEPTDPIRMYVGKNDDEEIRSESSSGGFFSLLSEQIIKQGGVVFGVQFNSNWQAEYTYTEDLHGLAAFRGSKYVQARVGNSFEEVKLFLKNGRKVLFSGTPCHVAGLRKFLRRDYDHLILIDFICHGVPSPMVWEKYLRQVTLKVDINPNSISFRSKENGWKHFSLRIEGSDASGRSKVFSQDLFQNSYMRGFSSGLYLRPSCHDCCARSLKSGSHLTIADFWGANILRPDLDDDKGLSLVLVNSLNMLDEYANIFSKLEPIGKEVLQYNRSQFRSTLPHRNRDRFFKSVDNADLSSVIEKLIHKSILIRLSGRLKKMLNKFFDLR